MVTALSRELPLATTQLSRDRGGGKYPGLGVGVRRTAPVAVAASGARWREGRREPGSAARGAAVPESAGGSRRERNQRRAEPAGAEAAAAAAELGAGTGLENAAFSSPPSCSTLVLEDQSLAAVTPCTPFVGQKALHWTSTKDLLCHMDQKGHGSGFHGSIIITIFLKKGSSVLESSCQTGKETGLMILV
ncbi:ADP-ribosylation factor 3 isoform X2 [Canis aureus]